MKVRLIGLFAVALAATSAVAQEHRELGPHVHGHGILNIAVEKNRVSIDLDVPGMDIVGFEHKPETADQKAVAKKAEADLAEALVLFRLPVAAGCKVAAAKVSIEAEGGAEASAEAKDGGADPSQKPADSSDEHTGHNDYNVNYTLDCAKPSEITSIQFDYFKKFAGAIALTVNVVSDKSQNSYEVSRELPVLELAGTM